MKLEKFNDFLAIAYMVFVLIWIAGAVVAVKFINTSDLETLGIGTATGILLAILKDVFQFYFRVNKPSDGNTK
jgi:hypothetical protein